MDECAEWAVGKPYESEELRLEPWLPYMFLGVMSWLMATMPRLASRASLKLLRSASVELLSLLMSIKELWRCLVICDGSARKAFEASDGCEERLSWYA